MFCTKTSYVNLLLSEIPNKLLEYVNLNLNLLVQGYWSLLNLSKNTYIFLKNDTKEWNGNGESSNTVVNSM